MDEATVGLDPASRESLLSQVHDLCVERQMCILWATHLIDEAEQAKQVLILHKGKLLEQDSPEQIVQKSGEADLLAAFLTLSGQQSTMSKPLLRSI
jgi:ABC-2 type transport system ATP-binding protein